MSPTVLESEALLPLQFQRLSYWILERNSPFSIRSDNSTGLLYLEALKTLDYETEKSEYVWSIIASDGDLDSLNPAKISVNLVNIDDNAQYSTSNSMNGESLRTQSFSAEVVATDMDRLDDIAYSISQSASDIPL